ncbi:MAG: hypothetical protein ACOCXA_04225 [Planctomycetota bacterium]
MTDHIAYWQGEMLWPQTLPDAPVLDFSGLEAVGVWVYSWLREHPGRSVVAASPAIKRQLQQVDVPVLWYRSIAEVPSADDGGVTPSEREMLWD